MPVKPREIWEKGTRLGESWNALATESNRERLRKLDSPNSFEIADNQILSEKLFHLSRTLQNTINKPKERIEIVSSMKRDLIEWLVEGEFYAFGFPVIPKAERTPRRIPNEFWANAEINWNGDIANDEYNKFQRIRIIDPIEFPEIDLKPKIGRKTNRELIYKAIADSLQHNANFANETHKAKANSIREFLKASNRKINPYGPGFGDDAIRKHVNSYFN